MNPSQQLDPNQLPSDLAERQAVASELKALTHAASARGELLTAMLHASDALMLFPNEREYLDLVDEVALSTQDPRSLVPVASGSVHVATAAARARILMMKKDMVAAIELITEVLQVGPESRLLTLGATLAAAAGRALALHMGSSRAAHCAHHVALGRRGLGAARRHRPALAQCVRGRPHIRTAARAVLAGEQPVFRRGLVARPARRSDRHVGPGDRRRAAFSARCAATGLDTESAA